MNKACIFVLLSFLVACQATIERSFLRTDTRRLIHFSQGFGFGSHGKLEIELRDIKIYIPKAKKSSKVDYKKFGFFLAPSVADIKLEQEDTPKNCALDRPLQRRVLFRFNDTDVQRAIAASSSGGSKGNATIVRKSYEFKEGGSYKLHFANCETDAPVSLKARIVMYNVDARNRNYYLSVGETELATMYTVMFFLFTAAAGGWVYLMHSCREQVHKIHFLMLTLVIFKALTLLCEAAKFHYVNATGRPEGWNIAYYIFTSLRGLMFFMVVVLIGTGWSYMKPFLGDRERKILMIVIPLQVFANIAIIVSGEETPVVQDWAAWQDIFHLVDIICCCAVLFPIVWSIKHLREAAQTDGKAARNMEKLTLFRQFYVMVVVYIYFTRIVVYLLESTMEYQYIWLSAAASELATLAFYVWTAVKFRPHQDNPYLKLHQEEIEMS